MKRAVALGLLFVFNAQAADFAVGLSARGNGSGSDWNNVAAWASVSLTRGNRYFLEDGSGYGSRTLSTPTSGTQLITIKKATEAEHGPAGGWQSQFGDGQAVFSGGLVFESDYWVIDGSKRNEANWADGNAYGFRMTGFASNTAWQGANAQCASNLTFQYINAGGTPTGNPPTGGVDAAFYVGGFAEFCQNWIMTRLYVHDTVTTFHMNGITGTNEISYSFVVNGWSKESVRGQIFASGFTIKHSIWKDACQGNPTDSTGLRCTAILGFFDSTPPAGAWDNTRVYGNVFWNTATNAYNDFSDGIILIQNGSGSVVYNNTFVGFGKRAGASFAGTLINAPTSPCRNNLSYDNQVPISYACSANSNNVNVTSDPFINYSQGNFRLTGATAAGFSLSAPYNDDMDGQTRGGDGVWDLGAFEYDSGTPPSAPTNFRLITVALWVLLGAGLMSNLNFNSYWRPA